METGLIFAIGVAVFYGLSDNFARRGVLRAGESYTTVLFSLFIGILFLSIIISVRTEWYILWHISERALKLLVAAGIMQFIGGRFLYFSAVRRIGTNKASIISRIQIPVAVILGIIILNETVSGTMILGVLFIILGVILTGLERKSALNLDEGSVAYRSQVHGILLALTAGFFWGISDIFIRPALQEIGSPFVGSLIAYCSALIVILAFLFGKGPREKVAQLNRPAIAPIIITGVLISSGNIFKYIALSLIPVSLVVPIVATTIIYVYVFAFLMNRKVEVFTTKVIAGILLAAAGTVIIAL